MADVMPPPPLLQQSSQTLSPSSEADMKLSMSPPSLDTPVNGNANSAANANRRPPRKSTLTQQQKNQKRQRATQDQLMTLEMEFNKNPTPTALVRERIASDINMTERSVQIWFQNRRAKIKNIAKRSIESGEDCDSIPESMRQYLAMQAYGPGGKGLPAGMFGRPGQGFAPYGAGTLGMSADSASGKTVIQHFHCRSLSVGTWRRVGQSTMDLVIFYSPDKACVTYYINNDSAGYKIEYPFASIKNIVLEQGDVLAAAEGASQRSGGLVVELTRPPKFFMDSSGSGGFYECGDFTEDQQASQVMVHHLGGPSKVLSGQLAKLVSLDAYQNRFNAHANININHFYDPNNAFALSAPVSPINPRPASQPNHMLHPHHAMNIYQSHDPNVGLMGPPGPRGHKRQRSRSVPVAVDVSMLRHPMPSFLIQQEGQPAPAPMHDPTIYAPQPQHQHPNGFAPHPHQPGPSLSIDTTAGYNMNMHFAGSLSATTANSPSDYGASAFFSPGGASEGLGAPQFHQPFGNGFLAVDPASMIGTSNTPLSVVSHGDPVIADHSPPLNGVGRSQSVDFFGTPAESSQLSDEGIYLSEGFNKQIALPFRGPMPEDSFQQTMHDGMFTFQSPPSSGTDTQGGMHVNGQPPAMNFQSPPHQTQDGSMYHTPQQHPQQQQQMHQDSGVTFSTPAHVVHKQAIAFNSPKDSGSVYQDNGKMYASPGQMSHPMPDESAMFQQHHATPPAQQQQSMEMHHHPQMYGFIDPHNLAQAPQQH